MLQFEDVLPTVVVKVYAGLLSRQPGLRGPLLGHKGRAGGRLGDLDPRQPRFL